MCGEYRKKLTVFVFLLWLAPLYAQSDAAGAERFVQRLSWDADPNVFKYVVEVAKEGGEVVERRTTAGDYVEVSLPPGRYRFTVDVYDLLDLFDYQMDAVSFEVLEALQPAVRAWRPKVFAIADGNGEVVLSGENFADGAQVLLRKDGELGTEITAQIQVLGRGRSARMLLPLQELEIGTWTIHLTNPGGLSTVAPGFRVKEGKKVGIDLSLLYSPLKPVNWNALDISGLNLFLDGNFLFDTVLANDYYHGGMVRLEWFPLRFTRTSLGLLLAPHLAILSPDLPSGMQLTVSEPYLGGVSLSFVVQTFLLRNRLALHFSMGGGMLELFNFRIITDDGTDTGYDALRWVFLDVGLSFKLFLQNSLFMELGASWNASDPFESPEFQYIKFFGGMGFSF
ncbi:MAG: hypothetical protein LBK61_05605 [Spirochaetaceae bacterium]|nr:hypothetical protein [Spirochaetaceae bacterium]